MNECLSASGENVETVKWSARVNLASRKTITIHSQPKIYARESLTVSTLSSSHVRTEYKMSSGYEFRLNCRRNRSEIKFDLNGDHGNYL